MPWEDCFPDQVQKEACHRSLKEQGLVMANGKDQSLSDCLG